MPLEIRPAPVDEVRVLRHLVLRPHQRPEEIVYEHDDDDALHFGAYVDGSLVAVASIAREDPPMDLAGRVGSDRAIDAWRIRGMATLPEHRGAGLSGELLERCITHAR